MENKGISLTKIRSYLNLHLKNLSSDPDENERLIIEFDKTDPSDQSGNSYYSDALTIRKINKEGELDLFDLKDAEDPEDNEDGFDAIEIRDEVSDILRGQYVNKMIKKNIGREEVIFEDTTDESFKVINEADSHEEKKTEAVQKIKDLASDLGLTKGSSPEEYYDDSYSIEYDNSSLNPKSLISDIKKLGFKSMDPDIWSPSQDPHFEGSNFAQFVKGHLAVTIFLYKDGFLVVEIAYDATGESENKSFNVVNENDVTDTLPPSINSFLEDMAQMTDKFDYNDIIEFGKKVTSDDLKKLRKFRKKLEDISDDDPEFDEMADEVAKIVKGINESDDLEISEDVGDYDKYFDYLDNLRPGSIKNIWGGDSEYQKKLSIASHLIDRFHLSDLDAVKIVAAWASRQDESFNVVNESDEDDEDQMTPEEVKEEALTAIKNMSHYTNEWSVRDTLAKITRMGILPGGEMASLDPTSAKKVAKDLYSYVQGLSAKSSDLDDIYDKVYHYADH